LLAELIIRHKNWIVGYHEHDSLLENQTNEELSEEERKAAWEDFENEKKGLGTTHRANTNYPSVLNTSVVSMLLVSIGFIIKLESKNEGFISFHSRRIYIHDL
jgi:transcriptional regulator ATRX